MTNLHDRHGKTAQRWKSISQCLTNPCWQWCYALVGGSDHGRWIGAHPWNFPLWLPMMAPFGPWQRLNSPLWRYLYKSICQMPPWCGRDRGSAGCWWCQTCALQSDTRRTCNHRDKVRMWPPSHLGFARYNILLVSVEGGKCKTFALVLPKEFTLLQADVMHLISRAAPVGAVPLICWTRTSLPVTDQDISLPIQEKTQFYIIDYKTYGSALRLLQMSFCDVLWDNISMFFRAANQ